MPFNPLIHGTTSLIFTNLDTTGNKLLPVIDMLESFKLAPMGGEISEGGLEGFNGGKELSFGLFKVNNRNQHTYDFEKITSEYASYTMCNERTKTKFLEFLKTNIENSYVKYFYNLNRILVYLARAKQLDANNNEIDAATGINKFLLAIKTSIKLAYLLSLIGALISLDSHKINTSNNKEEIINQLSNYFNKETQQQILSD